MKYLLLALFGVCWATSIKDKDIFKPFSDEMIEYINKYSGAKWKLNWAAAWQNQPNDMRAQQGSDKPRHPRLIKSLLFT